MKIQKIKWKNHPVLGDLELDLINPTTSKAFDTIVLAGENGTGKTTILETISTFLNLGSFEYFEYVEYFAEGKIYKAVPSTADSAREEYFDILDDNGGRTQIRSNKNNNRSEIESNRLDIRHYGCVFSKARADYKTQQITSTTTKALDIDKYDTDKEDDFTSSKQLLVDIQNQDNSDYVEVNKNLGSSPKSWNDYYLSSKIYRFKNAFDNFFKSLRYDKVADQSNQKVILFNKNGKSISIDNLSTGEKQIVFRGVYLLKNNKKLSDSAIMIDEPELSMHPKWQKNILKYYKDLFTDGAKQTAQLFIATHSEYVLEDALQDKQQNLVIALNENSGLIKAHRVDAPSVLPSITSAETNYLAFDIVSNDYHIELYGWLQHKESKNTIKTCDDYIKAHPLYNPSTHRKPSSFNTTTYDALSTYIRNAIDHPDPSKQYTEAELRTSIELLIELCR